MFIGVLNYRTKDMWKTDKVAVFDTEDCSCELVSVKDVLKYGYDKIANLVFNDYSVRLGTYSFVYAAVFSEGIGVYLDEFNRELVLHDRHINFRNGGLRIEFNGIVYGNYAASFSGWKLAYPFLFQDYTVMRMLGGLAARVSKWYTVVLNKNGEVVDHWAEGEAKSALALKLDTISEV